jgi:hypothetical protein
LFIVEVLLHEADQLGGGPGGTMPWSTLDCRDRTAEGVRRPIAARMAFDMQGLEGNAAGRTSPVDKTKLGRAFRACQGKSSYTTGS